MKSHSPLAIFMLTPMFAAESCHAHVPVLRFRLASSKSENAVGTSSEPPSPATISGLLLVDLDTDYAVEANESADRLWASPRIKLSEKPRSGTKPAQYSFRVDYDRDSDSLAK